MADQLLATSDNVTAVGSATAVLIASIAFTGGVSALSAADLVLRGGLLEAHNTVTVTQAAHLAVGHSYLAHSGHVTVTPPSTGTTVDLQPKLKPSPLLASVDITSANLTKDLILTVSSNVSVEAGTCFLRGRQALGFCDMVNEVLWLWGIQSPATTDSHIRNKAVNDINNALQYLWSQAKDVDYWSRSTVEITFLATESVKTLDDNIQNIVGPVRLQDGQTLTPLNSRSEYDNYGTYYLGQTSRVVADATPEAYYLERINQDSLDPVRANLHIIPAPALGTVVQLDVTIEAPRYTWSDYRTCTNVPVPHRYAESILLPLIRHRAMSFYLFIKPERVPMIEKEYELALYQLGVNDPIQGKEEADDQR